MRTVRDGQIVWPYCTRCGCRLEMFEEDKNFYFRHYEGRKLLFGDISGYMFVDARGCLCINEIWSVDDRIIPQSMV